MLRFLLVLAFVATCMADAKLALCRDTLSLKAAESELEVPLAEDVAQAVLDKSTDKSNVLSSMLSDKSNPLMLQKSKALVSGPRISPSISSLGPVISSQPRLRCPPYRPFSWAPQDLCPSSRVRVHTVSSSYGFCYVLFPQWQNIYESRCLCPSCRINCTPTNNTYRHVCVRDPTPTVYRKVWAICYKSGSWQIRNFSHKFSYGKCNCKTYYRGRCLG